MWPKGEPPPFGHTGGMNKLGARMDAQGMHIAVIAAKWNELVTDALVQGAIETLEAHGNPEITLVRVAGTWEIPPIAAALIERKKVDAVVALGCILQGATTHAALLAGDVSSALMSLQTRTGVPIAWGILTPENQEQALERAGMKLGNKGREAALAAIESASLLKEI